MLPGLRPEFVDEALGRVLLRQYAARSCCGVVHLHYLLACQHYCGDHEEVQRSMTLADFKALGSDISMIRRRICCRRFSLNSTPISRRLLARPTVLEFLQVPSNMGSSRCMLSFLSTRRESFRSKHMGSEDRFFKDQEKSMRRRAWALLKRAGAYQEERRGSRAADRLTPMASI